MSDIVLFTTVVLPHFRLEINKRHLTNIPEIKVGFIQTSKGQPASAGYLLGRYTRTDYDADPDPDVFYTHFPEPFF